MKKCVCFDVHYTRHKNDGLDNPTRPRPAPRASARLTQSFVLRPRDGLQLVRDHGGEETVLQGAGRGAKGLLRGLLLQQGRSIPAFAAGLERLLIRGVRNKDAGKKRTRHVD